MSQLVLAGEKGKQLGVKIVKKKKVFIVLFCFTPQSSFFVFIYGNGRGDLCSDYRYLFDR